MDLPIVGNDRCREMHRGNFHITNTKICAGGKRNEGVCEVHEQKQFLETFFIALFIGELFNHFILRLESVMATMLVNENRH